ncbi:unnamed protein product [Scytosiphon promiscuus]
MLPVAGRTPTTRFEWRCFWLFGVGVVLACCCMLGADAHTLRLRVQPGRALGGEAFLEQPQVEILEGDGGDVDVLFQGYATAEMMSSPSGYSILEYDNATDRGSVASFTDGKGRATFSGLFVNETGEGFVSRFVAFNAAGVGVAWIDSEPFDVGVGEPYAIAMTTSIGRMHAGYAFDIPPVICVQDKGGNVVDTYSGGQIAATLVAAPGSGVLLPAGEIYGDIQYGYAYFNSLYINEAGVGYRLGFNATGLTTTFGGGSYVESSDFTVGVGPAYRLELEEDIFDGTILSGSPFEDQPRVRAYDLGDNMLLSSESAVLVSVLVNPAAATLRPVDRVFEASINILGVMTEGVATFGGLSLDRRGRNVKLRFSLFNFDRSTARWNETDVHLDTDFFHVEEGVPAALHMEQDVDGAWAGGRGFKKQPYLTVVDAGGGTITMDSTTTITAAVTPSLMVDHDVVVDTSLDPSVSVTRVYTAVEDGSYGVGADIPVTVVFSAPVYADTSNGGSEPPYLYLSGAREGDGSSGLPAIVANSTSLVGADESTASEEMTFVYTVQFGDSSTSPFLEVDGRFAIRGGDAPLVDVLGREVNVTLPEIGSDASLSGASSVSVHASEPVIVAVGTSLDGGEYGVGQIIPVWVNFSFPVVVVMGAGASPPLLAVGGFNDSINGSSSMVWAEYAQGSGTLQLVFEYTVQAGDSTAGSPLGLTVPNGENDSVILPRTALLSYVASPKILQMSSRPSLAANLTLAGVPGGEDGGAGLGTDGGSVTVDTALPEVDTEKGVEVSGGGNGTYAFGDTVYITAWFSKPVAVFADIGLLLATNNRGARADFFSGGNGTHDVTFKYNVVEGDFVALLDIYGRNALDVGDGGYIRRFATNPVQDADIDLAATMAAGKNLARTSAVALDGVPPFPISVSLASGTPDAATYGLGDVIRLVVTFDKNITILVADSDDGDGHISSPPVLVLDCMRMREAVFNGEGNESTTLYFEYEVQMGDYASNLGYRFFPNALCLESGCPTRSRNSIREKKIRGGTGIDASLTLSNSLGIRASGVPVATAVAIDTTGSRETHVVGVSTDTFNGTYGAGQVIDIAVEFSDELLLETSGTRSSSSGTLPTIYLNNGGEAELVGGTGTREWLFSYTFLGAAAAGTEGSSGNESDVPVLDIANGSFPYPAAINCTDGCRAPNWNGVIANLSLEGFNLSHAGIGLNATAPVVVELYSPKETSPWSGIYTVGEEIEVRVVFDQPVVVSGSPRLLLDTGGYALYDGTSEDGTEVRFMYAVHYGEQSPNVTWAGSLALGANVEAMVGVQGGSEDWILRLSTNPSTPADVSLPEPVYPLARGGSTIHVNTTSRPKITNVTSPNMNGTYAPGDIITVWVTFDQHVAVIGEPVFGLNTGKGEPGTAVYVGGSGSQTLFFEYEVIAGDLTDRLACSDRHALVFGFNATLGSTGYESKLRSLVAQASTNPTVAVDRVLPFHPGEEGSLSFNSDIALDGSIPHIREIYFPGVVNASYQGGDVVQIVVRFSAPVAVTGEPALKLETGVFDREAVWVNTTDFNSSTAQDSAVAAEVENDNFILLFEYVVVTGDSADDLDYWADDEARQQDARASFLLPTIHDDIDDMEHTVNVTISSIKRLSANPSLDADLHLNPPGGMLSGTDRATAFGGWFYFRDLFVRTRGKGYKLMFEAFFPDLSGAHALSASSLSSSVASAESSSSSSEGSSSSWTANKERGLALKSSTLFEVGFAVEFEVMSEDSDRSDLFGQAISLDGGLLLAGAPKKHREVPEVQLVVSTGTASQSTSEVQMIAIDVLHVKEIQQFITYADPYETVGGFWSLYYPGKSRNIPADATIEQVQAGLTEDFPTLGRMLVVREEYAFCACEDGFIWTVTFDEAEGDILSFVPDASELTGTGANTTEVNVLQDSPVIGGTFTLSYAPWSASNYTSRNDTEGTTTSDSNETATTLDQGMLTTRPLPYDANSSLMSTVLWQDLNLSTVSVSVDCCDEQGGRKWIMDFSSDQGDWNISSLTCDASGLTGNRAGCWQLTGREGEGPVTGEFRINFRESDWTPWLPYDVGADDMQTALLGLQSIEDCEVSRSPTGSAGQHVWAVTFLEVRKPTDFGYVLDDMGNMPSMEIDATRIRGTDATMEIRYVFGGDSDYAAWEGKQMGSYGEGAGAAYVFSRSPAAEGYVWAQDQKLLGSDTDGQDGFGHSVSVDEDHELLIVGAPYAEDYGVTEVQGISCRAMTGTFTLGFRGFATDPIPANASIYELYIAIKGPFGTTKNLHPFPEIDVTERFPADWAASYPAGLCTGNNSALLALRTPRHDYWGGSGDLEMLTVDESLLEGDVTIEEVVKGTANPDGPFSRGVQKGAAYVFRRSTTSGLWYEESKLFLDDGLGTDRYGWQVVAQGNDVINDYVIVSAPGRDGEKGSVHVYTYSETESRWSLLQTITSELWSLGQDKFGSSLSLSGETLVVGGVGYNSSAGAAYVFTVSRSGIYQADQQIIHPEQPRSGDRFGESVSLYGNFLAVGCPGREDTWLHTGTVPTNWEGEDVGAVYLYRRDSAENAFAFFQKLVPSNVKPFDRLGVSVSIDGDALIVGSHQEFEEGKLAYQRAVQVVTIQSDPGGAGVGNIYRLGWKDVCVDDDDDICQVRWTRDIETDASGVELKTILEEDFGLGVGVSELVVARSGVDDSTGGYQYSIIFLEETGDVPQMLVDDSLVSGPNAYVNVESLNEVPGKLRGVTHVFARQIPGDVDSSFREQCFLYPWIKQRQDLFGTNVAVSGQFVAVSAPNRDTIHGSFEDQNITSLNTGAVEVFNLDFLSFRFDRLNYSVLEGDTLSMNITRFSELSTTQVFTLKSMDRNADQEFQDYIAAVYDLSVAYPDVPVFRTAADVVGAGTATARSQYYGSANNRSLWVGGMFDYRGLSDYTPLQDQLQFSPYETRVSYLLNTTDDNVVETPDESLTVSIYVPGMFPSFLGDLIAVVAIEDNGDGEGPHNSTASWGTIGAADEFTTFMDSKVYTSKVSADDAADMNRFGGALDSAEDAGLMIVGDEFSEIDGHINCGSAYIFRLEYGAWQQEAQLLPGSIAKGAHFGQAVQIDKVYGREMFTALVGAPGQALVYSFEYNTSSGAWDETETLTAAGVNLPNHAFGGKNSLSLSGDLAVVGAPGAESVFLFYRTRAGIQDGNGTLWEWGQSPVEVLVSSDFDYDMVHLLRIVHRQDYGAAVTLDVTSRTLAVGSPLADYDKLGTDEPETYDTRPDKAGARARGKVYIYHSEPAVQSVTLGTEFGLSAGTFKLSLHHRNTTSNTTEVSWNAQAADFKEAVEALSNVEEVEVTKDEWTDDQGFDFYRWTVSFTSEFVENPPLLVPSWGGAGCSECTWFSSEFPRNGGAYINVSSEETIGEWGEQAVLQASDRRSGDRFGSTVVLDQETLVVGAYHSSALAETTWDFETGDLVGWRQTGNAFTLQPTYGDNSYFRESSRGSGGWSKPSRSCLKGRYYVGTFEARPGAGAGDYTNPSLDHRAGSHQGDGPTGTLTSEVFTIGRDDDGEASVATIQILVGGGCDERTEYVELLVDGVSVAKATGMCAEDMRPISWDVAALAGRAGQIRIVDASSASPWGHINVDEIVLSWRFRGGLHPERAANVSATGAPPSSKAHYVAREDDTSRAGAVYVFSRLALPASTTTTTTNDSSTTSSAQSIALATPTCTDDNGHNTNSMLEEQPKTTRYYCPRGGHRGQHNCGWEESAKLTASDRRGGDLFGTCVSVNHDNGIVVVGAPGASLTGLWREPPTVYTTTNPHGDAENALATRVPLPMDERIAKLLRFKGAYGSSLQAGSGAPAIWELQDSEYSLEASDQQFNTRGNAQAGAVYTFVRLPVEAARYDIGRKCELDREGDIIAGHWPGVERFKLQAHDALAADRFGSAVSYSAADRTLFVGAPYSDSFGPDAGAVYQFDVGIEGAFFKQAEFSVEEGHWRHLHEDPQYLDGWKATVLVARDSDHADFWLTVAFATSDLTARGIDSDAYRECSELPVENRSPGICGDYEQTAGELTFEPGQTEQSFFVRIMDDHCRERYPEYVQLSLSIPGGGALQGEQYLAKLRIEDDDRGKKECQ